MTIFPNGEGFAAPDRTAPTGHTSEHEKHDPDVGRWLLEEQAHLPTAEILQAPVQEDEDPSQITADWVLQLSRAVSDGDEFADLFWEHGVWKDRIVFTFDYRTFIGQERIRTAATDLLPRTRPMSFSIVTPPPKLNNMPGDLTFIQASISFSSTIATAVAVVNLIKTADRWVCWTMCTTIEGLLAFPEIPAPKGGPTEAVDWQEKRDMDVEFRDKDPDVLIIGGGQCGLLMAARLETLGVSYLVVERDGRIGDSWRTRYATLSFHNPNWADHMPYLPFPERWPTYSPAGKHANWLESYADALDLKHWTNCDVRSCKQNSSTLDWTVDVIRGGKEKRTLKTKHVIMATGYHGMIDSTRRLMGDEVAGRLRPIMGVDKEGEISGAFRVMEVPNLWYIMGGISIARFESQMMALRIKAMLEGIALEPYL